MERIKSFRFLTIARFQVCYAMLQRDVTKGGHPQPGKSELVHSLSFWDLQICTKSLRNLREELRVVSCDFMGRFQIAHLNPQIPRSTMDIDNVSRHTEL